MFLLPIKQKWQARCLHMIASQVVGGYFILSPCYFKKSNKTFLSSESTNSFQHTPLSWSYDEIFDNYEDSKRLTVKAKQTSSSVSLVSLPLVTSG